MRLHVADSLIACFGGDKEKAQAKAHQLTGDIDSARADYEYVHKRAPRLIDDMEFTKYVDAVTKN